MNRAARRKLTATVLNRRARLLFQRYRELASGQKERAEVNNLFFGAALSAVNAAKSLNATKP
jgi:hypothetical protein